MSQADSACPHCGKPVTPNAKFCRACGKPVKSTSAQPAPGVDARKKPALSPVMLIGAVAAVCGCIALTAVVAGTLWFNYARAPQFKLGTAKTYAVSAAKDLRITDSATGQTLRFPEGGTGNIQIAKIATGPAAPFPGEGIWVDYKGNTPVQLLFKDTGDDVRVMGYGRVTIAGQTGTRPKGDLWVPLSEGVKVDGFRAVNLPLPTQRQGGDAGVQVAFLLPNLRLFEAKQLAQATASARGFQHYWIAYLKPDSTAAQLSAAFQRQIYDELEYFAQTLPPTLQAQTRTRMTGAMAWRYDDCCRYLWPPAYTPHFVFASGGHNTIWLTTGIPVNQREELLSHEAGHYMHHVLVGDAVYNRVVSQDVGEHGLGDYHPGRVYFMEEPAYYAEYFFRKKVATGADPSEPWRTNLYGIDVRAWKKDIPSIEGFGVAFLLALQRTSDTIQTRDSSNRLVTSALPTIGLSEGEIFEILSQGATNVTQLYTDALSYITRTRNATEAQKLAVVAQRVGWGYNVKGRLVDSIGKPLGTQKIQAISRVDCRDYEGGFGVTASDGTFVLFDVFPGDSMIRTDPPPNPFGSSTDAFSYLPLKIDWSLSTEPAIDLKDQRVNQVEVKLDPGEVKSKQGGRFTFTATANNIPATVKSIRWEWSGLRDYPGTVGAETNFSQDTNAQPNATNSAIGEYKGCGLGSRCGPRVVLYDTTCGKDTMLAWMQASVIVEEPSDAPPITPAADPPTSTPTRTRTPTATPTSTPTRRPSAPQIVSVEIPVMLGDGTPASGKVRFTDPDGDVNWAAFEATSGDFDRFSFNPLSAGTRLLEGDAKNGVFEFKMSCQGASRRGVMQLLLLDAAGNSSAPYTFSVECRGVVTPTPTPTATRAGTTTEACPTLGAVSTANGRINPFTFSIFRTEEGNSFEERTSFPGNIPSVYAHYDYSNVRAGVQAVALWCRNGNVYYRSSWTWDYVGTDAWSRIADNALPAGNYEFRLYLGGVLAQVGKFTINPPQTGTVSAGPFRFAEGVKDGRPVNLHAPNQNFKYGIREVFAFYEFWYWPPSYAYKVEWYRNGTLDFQKTDRYSNVGSGVVFLSFTSHFEENRAPLEPGSWEVKLYIDNRVIQSGKFVIER